MKRLAKSRLTDKHCYKCDSLLVSNTFRYVDGGMHYCYVCPIKESKVMTKQTAREFLEKYCTAEGWGTEESSLIEALTEGERVWNDEYMDQHRWYICNEVVNKVGDKFIKYTDYIAVG